MRSKMRSLMLCVFCLFQIVRGQMFDRDNLKNHHKCWTYMNCISDGPMARKMESCLSLLKPEDLKLIVKYVVENGHKFRNRTVSGALSEYCHMTGDEQKDVYNKMVDAMKGLEKVVCDYPDMADFCSRGEECMNCAYFYLEKHFLEDECKID